MEQPSYDIIVQPLKNCRNLPVIRQIVAIDQEVFDPSWSEHDVVGFLHDPTCAIFIARKKREVIGYMVYQRVKNKIQILNVTVRDVYRRRKVGSDMVSALLTYCAQVDSNMVIFAEVREHNLIAQVFFRRLGFNYSETLPSHFSDNGEDAYVLKMKFPARSK